MTTTSNISSKSNSNGGAAPAATSFVDTKLARRSLGLVAVLLLSVWIEALTFVKQQVVGGGGTDYTTPRIFRRLVGIDGDEQQQASQRRRQLQGGGAGGAGGKDDKNDNRRFDVYDDKEDECIDEDDGTFGSCDEEKFPVCDDGELICYNRRPRKDKFYEDDRQPYFYIDYRNVYCCKLNGVIVADVFYIHFMPSVFLSVPSFHPYHLPFFRSRRLGRMLELHPWSVLSRRKAMHLG